MNTYYHVKVDNKFKNSKTSTLTNKDTRYTRDTNNTTLDEYAGFEWDRISNLYEQVIERFRVGGYEVYNPRFLHYLTLDRFAEWIIKNNPNSFKG